MVLEGSKGSLEDFIGILESASMWALWEGNPISLASYIGRGKLHLLMEKMPLLFLENLAEVFIQAKKGGGHSGLSYKLVVM